MKRLINILAVIFIGSTAMIHADAEHLSRENQELNGSSQRKIITAVDTEGRSAMSDTSVDHGDYGQDLWEACSEIWQHSKGFAGGINDTTNGVIGILQNSLIVVKGTVKSFGAFFGFSLAVVKLMKAATLLSFDKIVSLTEYMNTVVI